MQRLSDAVVDRDEAALLDVIGDWEETSQLELVEGAFMPQVSIVFVPACHVQVAADDVHSVAGAELACFVDGFADLPDARLRFLLHGGC